MTLADLRKIGLPPDAVGRQRGQEADPPLSARSVRSARSEVQSEGGHSVKSTSIKRYMGVLSEQRSPAEVKLLVKDFVKQMVKGREIGVLCADGTMKPVLCALTRSLDTLRIKAGGEVRKVPLSEVDRIIVGNPEELSDLATPLDEACSTLELASAECISFKFAEQKAAELFTLCMQIFVDGQKP